MSRHYTKEQYMAQKEQTHQIQMAARAKMWHLRCEQVAAEGNNRCRHMAAEVTRQTSEVSDGHMSSIMCGLRFAADVQAFAETKADDGYVSVAELEAFVAGLVAREEGLAAAEPTATPASAAAAAAAAAGAQPGMSCATQYMAAASKRARSAVEDEDSAMADYDEDLLALATYDDKRPRQFVDLSTST